MNFRQPVSKTMAANIRKKQHSEIRCPLEHARARLTELLRLMRSGKKVVLTFHNKPVARLVEYR